MNAITTMLFNINISKSFIHCDIEIFYLKNIGRVILLCYLFESISKNENEIFHIHIIILNFNIKILNTPLYTYYIILINEN